MDSWLIAAALLSALLHASWNAAVKASGNAIQAMHAQMLVSALIGAPVLLWYGLPDVAAWPWIAISAIFSLSSVACMLRGYQHAGFGMVYPLTRASSILLVLPLASAVAGEWTSPLGVIGVTLVSLGVLMLALGSGRVTRAMTRPALGWTLAAGALTAGYVICDAQGVRRSGNALAYGGLLSIANALLWTWMQRHSSSVRTALSAQWRRAVPVAAASMASYWLILWVWTLGPIALAAALRDTSAIFAALIAIVVLKEPMHRGALLAVVLATAGSMLIRLA